MTREEAIAKLKNFADHCDPNEEFLMAIEALSAIEDIKAEIEVSKWTDKDTKIERNALASGLDKALEIIDKHICGKESE